MTKLTKAQTRALVSLSEVESAAVGSPAFKLSDKSAQKLRNLGLIVIGRKHAATWAPICASLTDAGRELVATLPG